MLTMKTLLGAGWTVSARLAGRLIDFVTVLVLARTLTPADFGLTALAMTLTVIADMVLEIPLIQALTRLDRLKKSHLDTAFTLGALRGLVLALVVLLAAWPFSRIYNDHRLFALVAVIVIGPIARSLYSPAMVRYIRDMSFRQVFIAEILGKIAAFIVAVSVVYLGGGYWAIAANSISAPVAAMLISYLLAPYRPKLSLANLADFSTFLGWLSMAQLVAALSWQFDRILLGYFVTRSDLGRYAMASDLSVLPTQSLIGPAMQPVMAAFSRINDDRERLRNAYSKASRFTMLLAAPACIGMAMTADLIVNALLGAKWNDAAIYLQWLALSSVLNAFYQPLHSLALATNRTNLVFRLSFIELCCKVSLMLLGLYFYSLMGVIAARGAVSLIMFVLSLLTAKYLVGTNAAAEIGHLWKVGAACAVMALFVLILQREFAGHHLNGILELGVTSALGAAVYIGALFVLGIRLKTISAQIA
ncbi:lipopolysaccharide biosynthesis protein [Bradyrhizobium canariense]|uniref:Polysaccharide transporter, PST family n=1 Tax=Bradyrhizobium canariense TaxID=255045 RepID=A0A1H2BIX3_9BRAD|nr:lipopolysaccharide biosynthesis protein [Bradyrhizobium canariense]SDT58290.1 polysaccharide transporter, PST family [Bradyrhizobium canariense]